MEIEERKVEGSAGAVLRCAHTPLGTGKRSVLIALPFGVPHRVAHAAFAAFAPAFDTITWESRYILDLERGFSGRELLDPLHHVEDMTRILDALQVSSCRLIGYCSGAGISLLAARERPDRFGDLVLVNGEYQLFRKGHESTDYQRSIDTFMPAVAAGRQQASLIFSKMGEISRASKNGNETELDRWINLPFSKEESLFRYALNYMAYRDFDALEVASGVRQRTFVLTGRGDRHSSLENSQAVSGSITGSRTFVDPTGDHYEFCRPGSRILEEIREHLVA